MKEQDTFVYLDNGVHEVSVKEYENSPGTRTVVYERMGVVARGQAPELRAFQGSDAPRTEAAAQDQRLPIRETGGKGESQNSDKPFRELEKKATSGPRVRSSGTRTT